MSDLGVCEGRREDGVCEGGGSVEGRGGRVRGGGSVEGRV